MVLISSGPSAVPSADLPKNKTELPLSRQPGYLLFLEETRGFPSPPHSGFGFFTGNQGFAKNMPFKLNYKIMNIIKDMIKFNQN
jgi:hypothetical protein